MHSFFNKEESFSYHVTFTLCTPSFLICPPPTHVQSTSTISMFSQLKDDFICHREIFQNHHPHVNSIYWCV